MTDGNPHPDEELTPPASTGWSDDASGGDDELAPPFIPGASPESTEPPEPPAETPPAGPEAGEAVAPDDEEAEPVPQPAAGPETVAPSRTGGASSTGTTEEETFPFEGGWAEEGGEEGPEAQAEEDDFPFEAFDIEGEDAGDSAVETPPAATTAAAHGLADRLEAMARRLREDGVEAVEAQMAASDRFTALLAGLLAGYLADRE